MESDPDGCPRTGPPGRLSARQEKDLRGRHDMTRGRSDGEREAHRISKSTFLLVNLRGMSQRVRWKN